MRPCWSSNIFNPTESSWCTLLSLKSYPSLKLYLKGFHLSLKTWGGGRNPKGWKECERQISLQELNDQADPLTSDEVKLQQLIGDSPGAAPDQRGPG